MFGRIIAGIRQTNMRGAVSIVLSVLIIASLVLLFGDNDFLPKFPDGYRHFNKSEIEWLENHGAMDDPDLHQYIRERWLIYPQKNIVRPNDEKHYSQVGQSLLVDEFLKRKRNGFFIESGAGNGVLLSNSLFFENSRNWTGLLVEPNDVSFPSVLKNRPGSYLMHACLSTTKTASRIDFEFNDNFNDWSKLKELTLGKAKGLRWVKIQCFPLYSILQAIGVDTIDYFSLDVEGAELGVLKTIPWDKIRINIITIEYRAVPGTPNVLVVSATKLEELRKFFKELKTYTEVKIINSIETNKTGLDVVFARSDIAPLKDNIPVANSTSK